MRFLRSLLLAGVGLAAPAAAEDLSKIDRSIAKEPAYAGKPRYALLVFGPKAQTRVWLILDGDTLYVDRNGNGDLTEEGKRVLCKERASGFSGNKPAKQLRYEVGEIIERGAARHARVQLARTLREGGEEVLLIVENPGGCTQHATLGEWAGGRRDAPVRHFNGPLRMGLEKAVFVRGERPTNLRAFVGTPCPAEAWVYVSHEKGIPAGVHPIAEVAFPPNKGDDRLPPVKVPLSQRREGALFEGRVRVPPGAAKGRARVALSFPDWKEGRVEPATVEVPIEEPEP
jgi:hypothetical protein